MTFVFVFVFALAAIAATWAAGYRAYKEYEYRKPMGISYAKGRHLSWPARQIMLAYHSLPEENRPPVDMCATVTALDKSFGGAEPVHTEFRGYNDNYHLVYSWSNVSRNHSMFKYNEICGSLQEIKGALDRQQKEFTIAGLSSDLDRVQDIINHGRTEVKMIDEVTTAVTGSALDGR